MTPSSTRARTLAARAGRSGEGQRCSAGGSWRGSRRSPSSAGPPRRVPPWRVETRGESRGGPGLLPSGHPAIAGAQADEIAREAVGRRLPAEPRGQQRERPGVGLDALQGDVDQLADQQQGLEQDRDGKEEVEHRGTQGPLASQSGKVSWPDSTCGPPPRPEPVGIAPEAPEMRVEPVPGAGRDCSPCRGCQ